MLDRRQLVVATRVVNRRGVALERVDVKLTPVRTEGNGLRRIDIRVVKIGLGARLGRERLLAGYECQDRGYAVGGGLFTHRNMNERSCRRSARNNSLV